MKYFIFSVFLALFVFVFLSSPKQVSAKQPASCDFSFVQEWDAPDEWPHDQNGLTITVKLNSLASNWSYFAQISNFQGGIQPGVTTRRSERQNGSPGSNLTFQINETYEIQEELYKLYLKHNESWQRGWPPIINTFSLGGDEEVCYLGDIYIYRAELKNISCDFQMPQNIQSGQGFNAQITSITPTNASYYFAIVPNPPPRPILVNNNVQKISGSAIANRTEGHRITPGVIIDQQIGSAPSTVSVPAGRIRDGNYRALMYAAVEEKKLGVTVATLYKFCRQMEFKVSANPTSSPIPASSPTSGSGAAGRTPPCIPGSSNCASGADTECDVYGTKGVMTAIGCVPKEPAPLVNGLVRVSVAAGGAIALLLMAFGVFRMLTSAGNPDVLKSGQDQFTNAIVGLLVIILAVLALQIIGVNILNIPGFIR